MTAVELLKSIISYGADEAGIKDRFGDNAELYELCLKDFLKGTYMSNLADAIAAEDYERAFSEAHALKGLTGNLGLTPYYTAICALVESLRAKDYTNVAEQHNEVESQFQILKEVYSGERLHIAGDRRLPDPPALDAAPVRHKREHTKKFEWFVPIAAGVALIAIILVNLLFSNLIGSYQRSIADESSGHLAEINYQLKEYIEDQIENDWLIAYTVKSYIARHGNDVDLLGIIQELSDLWKVTDIVLYTEDGYNISGGRHTMSNDLASQLIVAATESSEYIEIVESDIIYTIPLDVGIQYKGSKIVALSVVKDMDHFLDEMNFSSFNQSAFVYLCNQNGEVISSLSNENAIIAYNIRSVFKDGGATTISGADANIEDMMAVTQPTVFIYNEYYVVFTPINTRQEVFKLAYFVPESIVNKTTSSFSGNVTRASLMVICVFLILALLAVVYVNGIRKKRFDAALLTRERMFDLLVKHSRTAFALFDITKDEPLYISSNSGAVVGDEFPILHKSIGGFEMLSANSVDTQAYNHINETLDEWDGKGIYRSGFILNDKALQPSYFEVQLMPVGEGSTEYVGVAQDVTQLKERENFIREALSMAEQASDAKTRFLSNMSHDIRTPMNAIVNMSDFAIEDMGKPEKLQEDLKTIREASDHLLGLINDILDMSRIESGKTTISAAPFDLLAELRRLKSIVSPLCSDKALTLITDFDDVPNTLVIGDQTKVGQILMNLLSNAVKFTPRNGAVRFTAKEAPSIRQNYLSILFTVEDTGMGISPSYLPHIFEPFSREDTKRISGIQGTGLGLSICHSYVNALGGQIKCESTEGDGTTFTVLLFFEKTDAAPVVKPMASSWDVVPFAGMRCLLCEDNGTNRLIGKTVLERLGFRVELARDGREGLAMFQRSKPGYFDAIYMDIQMPDMDGYEATVAIRESDHPQARTLPIIALSANVFIEDVEKAHIAGMDGHVGKPISTVELANETKRVFTSKRRVTE